jgi:hypothetical protein
MNKFNFVVLFVTSVTELPFIRNIKEVLDM